VGRKGKPEREKAEKREKEKGEGKRSG